MCAANKSRLADQVFIIAERAPEYAGLRTRLAAADDKTLADYVLHEKSPLVERALCLWYLAGHRRFPSERMPARVGSVEKAVEVLQSLNAPADLKAACIAVLIKTQYPLALFTPLLAHSVQHMPRPLYIWYDKLYQAETVNAIPAYAADTFILFRSPEDYLFRVRYARTSQSMFGSDGMLETLYFGKGAGNQTCIYNKARHLNGKKAEHDTVRIEARLRPKNLKIRDLWDLQNPLRNVQVYSLKADSLPFGEAHWIAFREPRSLHLHCHDKTHGTQTCSICRSLKQTLNHFGLRSI